MSIGDRFPGTCAVDDCERGIFSRDWCQKHYTRWLRHGDPTILHSTREIPPLDRVMALVERDGPSGCWLWQGPLNQSGYACRRPEKGTTTLVHRWLYEQLVGPIPDGLPLDHLCRVRRCVNPAHLEPVTDRENWIRGESPSAVVVRTNLCKRGHDLAVYEYVRKDGRGRHCGECQRIRLRRRREAA